MNILLRYHRCLHLLVCLGILAYSVAEENLIYAMIAVPVVIAAYLIVGGPGGRPLPRWIINLALLFATGVMAMNWTEPLGNTITVLCTYLVWLQLIKLFEPRTSRDQSQIILLSLMLAVGACLTSVTPEMGAVLVVYLPVLLVTVMLFQLYAAQAHVAGEEPEAASGAVQRAAIPGWWGALVRFVIGSGGATTHQHLPRIVHASARGRANLSRTAMLAGMIIAALAPMVYIAFPRGVGENFFGPWQPANAPATAGFRDHVQLGAQGIISESQRIVMKVKIESTDPTVLATGRPYRLRGAVLDRYDPEIRMWRRSSHVSSTDRRFPVGAPDFPRPTNPRGPLLLVHVTLLDQPVSTLFTVWKPLWLTWEGGVRRPVYISNHFDGQVEIARRVRGMSYTAVCSPGEPTPSGPVPYMGFTNPDPPFLPEVIGVNDRGEPFVGAPPAQFQSGPIHDLAQRILSEGRIARDPEDWEYARRVVSTFARYLSTRYTYTTQMTAPAPGEDPIEMFLFDEERGGRGHCEYFASALAAMSLAAGIPARVVTGYVASEFDPVSETYTVRENQAHAWVEAEVRPGLWEEFDPSPLDDITRLHNPQGSIASALRRMIDALQFAWIEGVVTFNRDRQSGTLQNLSIGPLEALRTLNNRVAAMLANEEEIAQENRAVYWTRLIGWIVLLATAVLLVGHIVVSRGVRLVAMVIAGGEPKADPGRLDPRFVELTRIYRRMLQSLARAGIAKPMHQPALAHLSSLGGDRAAIVAPAMSLTELYYRARFAGEAVRREDLAAAEGSLRAVEAAARERRKA